MVAVAVASVCGNRLLLALHYHPWRCFCCGIVAGGISRGDVFMVASALFVAVSSVGTTREDDFSGCTCGCIGMVLVGLLSQVLR